MLLLLFIAAAIAYGAASVAYGYSTTLQADPERERRLARVGRLCVVVGAVLHFAAIGDQCIAGDHPLKNIFLATSFGSLVAVLGYLLLSTRNRLDALGPVMGPVGLVGLVLGVVYSGVGQGEIPGAAGVLSSHVGLASAGLAGFTLAAGVAGVYLAMERRLRNKVFRPVRRGLSLTGLDQLHHRLVLLVTPVFTLAIVTGVLVILEAGGPESLSARRIFEISAAGVAWLAAVSILVARAVWGTRGRHSAWLTLLAFGAVIVIVISYGIRA